mgnify:CR=1 FL=1
MLEGKSSSGLQFQIEKYLIWSDIPQFGQMILVAIIFSSGEQRTTRADSAKTFILCLTELYPKKDFRIQHVD